MKKIQLLTLLLAFAVTSFAQDDYELVTIGGWDDDNLPTHFYGTFNDIWGYAAPDGREYALLGSAAYVHIIDVTDPINSVEIERFEGGVSTVWRDMKTYQDRMYACSDNSGEGLIIVDMSDLPNSATKTYQSPEFFGSAHDIFIDEANARLYAVGGPGSMVILDISNPDVPQFLAQHDLNGTYIHDLYVRDNIAYCSSGWDGFYVWDLNDVQNPVLVATLETNGYNHSNWVSDDGNTIIVAEEVPTGLPMLMLDATNLMDNDLTLQSTFVFPNIENAPANAPDGSSLDMYATPHNPYILGDLAYVSYYEDGVVVFDISDPANPEKVAVHDTHPKNDDPNNLENYGYHGYAGCWGVYPFLPSGNIISSDFDAGLTLHELEEPVVISTNELPTNINKFQIKPTPAGDFLTVTMESSEAEVVSLKMTDMNGRLVMATTSNINGAQTEILDLSSLSAGMYFLSLSGKDHTATRKVVKK